MPVFQKDMQLLHELNLVLTNLVKQGFLFYTTIKQHILRRSDLVLHFLASHSDIKLSKIQTITLSFDA